MEKDQQSNVYPNIQPPPYSGPPGPNYPGPPPDGSYPGYPMTEQPHVTMVHPVNTTVIHSARLVPAVVVTNNMSPSPAPYVCRSCNQQIITRVQRSPTIRTHLFAALLCVFGCWPCVCLPYCMDTCNNAEHYCPNCNAYIGSYIG